MKVIFFSPGQNEVGGCATRARLISLGLAERDWEIFAICRAATATWPRVVRKRGLTIIEIPGCGVRVAVAFYVLLGGVLGLVLGGRAIFLAMQLGSQTLVGGICASLLRRPFIVLSTTGGELSEVKEVQRSRARFLHRRNLRAADCLVGQTAQAAHELEAFVPSDRVAVVPNPMPKVAATTLNGQPNALFTGRLTREKDLPTLLDAWEEVSSRRPAARLTLVGSGGKHRSVERELHVRVSGCTTLTRSVSFTGWVNDVGDYLENADVYLFPSRSEGMSNSLLEACAWGRVVVASDIDPNRAVLGDNYPLLFPTGDSNALAKVILRAFDDDEIRNGALAAIQSRMNLMSMNSVISSYEAILAATTR